MIKINMKYVHEEVWILLLVRVGIVNSPGLPVAVAAASGGTRAQCSNTCARLVWALRLADRGLRAGRRTNAPHYGDT